MVRDIKPVQPSKAEIPIDVTELGMVRDVKPVQPENAEIPIDVTELGMVTDVKPVQPLKVYPSIDVTPSGILRDVKPVQPENAASFIVVTVSGIVVVLHPEINALDAVSIMALQPSLESYMGLPSSTTIDVKLVQSSIVLFAIEVTELGMVREVKLEHPLKA